MRAPINRTVWVSHECPPREISHIAERVRAAPVCFVSHCRPPLGTPDPGSGQRATAEPRPLGRGDESWDGTASQLEGREFVAQLVPLLSCYRAFAKSCAVAPLMARISRRSGAVRCISTTARPTARELRGAALFGGLLIISSDDIELDCPNNGPPRDGSTFGGERYAGEAEEEAPTAEWGRGECGGECVVWIVHWTALSARGISSCPRHETVGSATRTCLFFMLS